MSSLFLCSLKASRETLPMNVLIVYILVENIKTGICVASEQTWGQLIVNANALIMHYFFQ